MKKIFKKWYFWVGAVFLLIIGIGSSGSSEIPQISQHDTTQVDSVLIENDTQALQENTVSEMESEQLKSSQSQGYKVTQVVDGDTIKVSINGSTETIRIIGINTPETVDPRKPVECFGKEASSKAKELLSGKTVTLEADVSQGERDKYGRLLRYVFLVDGTDFGKYMILNGYAYEYTYSTPYAHQTAYTSAQSSAQSNKAGLWSPNSCSVTTTIPGITSTTTSTDTGAETCTIKGNISSEGEKIYHVQGCTSYNQTQINESKGEKWFCTEGEALNAGWRKALNC